LVCFNEDASEGCVYLFQLVNILFFELVFGEEVGYAFGELLLVALSYHLFAEK